MVDVEKLRFLNFFLWVTFFDLFFFFWKCTFEMNCIIESIDLLLVLMISISNERRKKSKKRSFFWIFPKNAFVEQLQIAKISISFNFLSFNQNIDVQFNEIIFQFFHDIIFLQQNEWIEQQHEWRRKAMEMYSSLTNKQKTLFRKWKRKFHLQRTNCLFFGNKHATLLLWCGLSSSSDCKSIHKPILCSRWDKLDFFLFLSFFKKLKQTHSNKQTQTNSHRRTRLLPCSPRFYLCNSTRKTNFLEFKIRICFWRISIHKHLDNPK